MTKQTLASYIKLDTSTQAPSSFQEEIFHIYSLPSYDENKTPELKMGREIKAINSRVSDHTILFNKLNVRFKRIWNIKELANKRSLCSSEFLRIKAHGCDQDFLYYILKSYAITERLIKASGGSSGSHSRISPNDLLSIKFTFPAIAQQRSIAAILNLIDSKINLNNKINAELEQTARLIYDYWFTQFDFPDAQGKPYKSSGGTMVYNDQLKRKIPENWGDALVSQHIRLQRGVSYTSSDISSGKGVPMINLGSIDKDRKYRDEKIKYHAGIIPKTKMAKPGDLLIACTDLTSDGLIIGCPIFTPSIYPECTFSMDLAKLEISTKSLLPTYLFHVLRTNWYHKYIKKFSSGTNVHHLDVSGVLNYKIEIPPIDIQQRFEHFTRPIYINSGKILAENKQLEELRDWLLPMLMTGQVKVV